MKVIELASSKVIGNTNHSLETGDTAKDLQNLILAQRQALDFILGGRDKG